MANELDATQGEPEGVTAAIPGNEAAPEQNENEQSDNANETDASAESSAEHDAQGDGEGGEERAETPEGEGQKRDKLPWYQKRINEETNRRRELDRKLQELAAENERLKSGGQVPEPNDQAPDLESLVDRRAQEKLQQQAIAQRTGAFDATGAKEFGRQAFDESCNLVASILDPREIPSFMDVMTDSEIVPDGHKVIMELANDPEEAERILRLPPVKRTVALVRLSEKLSKPSAPAPKPLSRAPAPVSPVGGNTKPPSPLENPDSSMDDFAREVNKMVFSKKR